MPHQEIVGPPAPTPPPKRSVLSRVAGGIGQGALSFFRNVPVDDLRAQALEDEVARRTAPSRVRQQENAAVIQQQEIEANQQEIQKQQEIQQLSTIAFDPANPDNDKALTRLFQIAPEFAGEVQKGLRIEDQAGFENAARRAASIQAQPTKELRDAEIRKQINDNPNLDLTETAQMLDMTFEQQEIPLRVTQAAALSAKERPAEVRAERVLEQGERRLDLTERGLDIQEARNNAAVILSADKRLNDQTQLNLKTEEGLRKEVNTLLKDFFQVADANARVLAAGTNPSAAGDLALIFNYMKLLDPGSTVREGEFATAQNSASIPQRVVSLYNRIVDGQRLSGPQREDFLARAESLFGAAQGEAQKTADAFERIATNAGVNVGNVLASFQERRRDIDGTVVAPEAAISFLRANDTPENRQQFVQKFGALPEGF